MSATKKKLRLDQNEITEPQVDSEVFNLSKFKENLDIKVSHNDSESL